jgi:predicted ferric reductase
MSVLLNPLDRLISPHVLSGSHALWECSPIIMAYGRTSMRKGYSMRKGPFPVVAATRTAPASARTTAPSKVSRTPRSVQRGLVLAVIYAGGLAVLGLWWKDTTAVHNLGDILTNVGRIAGLLAAYGFVVLVGLMARLPPLERGIGADRLARWHAMGGRYVITMVTVHVLFITWGYAVTAHQSVARQAVTFLTSYPDLLTATIAFFLLLLIAGLSARAARRKVSYEAWYYVHLLTYASIALAFSHQLADGASFIDDQAARILWTLLYAVVGGLILWYRFVTPLLMFARHRFTVVGVRQEAPGVVSVYIGGRNLEKTRAEAGQFFRWRFLSKELFWGSHPYSLSAAPGPDLLRITVKATGHHSRSMAHLRPGTKVIAEGPYGAFTPSMSGRRVLMIAGGVGITPIRAMFAALPKRVSEGVTLIYRASHPREIVFRRELDAIAADRNATVHYIIGPRAELGYDPLAPEEIEALVPGLHRYEAYVCGPNGMTEASVASLRALGVKRRHIHHETFDF